MIRAVYFRKDYAYVFRNAYVTKNVMTLFFDFFNFP